MAKKKGKNKGKASAKTTPKHTPKKSTPHRTPSKFQPWPDEQAAKPKYSLADEARFVAGHRKNAFEAGKRLRDMPVQFVSAGLLVGTIKEREDVSAQESDSESDSESIAPSTSSSSSPPDNTRAMAQMAIRSPSPALSESSSGSSDKVVFQGRGSASAPLSTAASRVESPLPQAVADTVNNVVEAASAKAEAVATQVAESASVPVENVHVRPKVKVNIRVKEQQTTRSSAPKPVDADSDSDTDSSTDIVTDDAFAKRRGGKESWEGTTTPWVSRSKPGIGWLPVQDRPDMSAFLDVNVNPRDAAMDDYMQNVEEFGLTGDMVSASGFARREMDLDAGSHNDWESASGSQAGDEEVQVDSWDSDMLQDFEGVSTSSEPMETVVRILSKRNRTSGVQYLCVYEGAVVDEALWLPGGFLQSSAEKDLIQAFEEDFLLRKKKAEIGDSSSSDSERGEDDDDDDDDEDDSNDNEQLDDETIARVLQKQEELGLGADELMLYAADDYFREPSTAEDFISFNVGRSNRKQKRGGRRNREPNFPSASAMADVLDMDPYNGFDIMDTERPSLKPKKKGRRGQMPIEFLDDSDLNEQMQNAWENDRQKKRLKKAEREELRQQGLLGRKGKAPDLKVKYKDGMTMEDVVEEIREFLVGDRDHISLPPMDAFRRAVIHQAADHFKLTSRSRGDGFDRFTVLTKTTRTRTYTDDEFDNAMLHKGLVHRLSGPMFSKKGDRPRKSATVRFGGARGKQSTGYRDGETVGANAPELGQENKGYNLLSKMGWKQGMALGAVDNKGILQPIPHTVKMTKAGLQ
ncbi:hypothetical protein C7974DRAFT_331861 [Boeremia exigua]|uniref:uncharacterized protein n=1 Tax=Boeremia exigua TaxID=749465 RepID=UPI001E8D2721|nr:uncharacterized protein C7974DRAFT_331861 [Boeremia exigua]KAH6637528.1 hypothetical protein C7974DRAFT_331861 [Boeremia exigua]